jgi:hypothetical protein
MKEKKEKWEEEFEKLCCPYLRTGEKRRFILHTREYIKIVNFIETLVKQTRKEILLALIPSQELQENEYDIIAEHLREKAIKLWGLEIKEP